MNIIRRVDDLGRILLPKEVRRSTGIMENDHVEIGAEQGKIVIEKLRPLNNMESIAKPVLNALIKYYGVSVALGDQTGVICSVGTVIPPETEYSENFLSYIGVCHEYEYNSGTSELYIDNGRKYKAAALIPVIPASKPMKCFGSLILLCNSVSGKLPEHRNLDTLRFAALLIAEHVII